jgi:hypothetical protein
VRIVTTVPRLRFGKLVRFVAATAWDLLGWDAVDKARKAYRNFHRYFLVLDLSERIGIYRELDAVTPLEEAELVEVVLATWAKELPPDCPLPPDARRAAIEFVKGLRAAKDAATAGRDAGEALRASLNASLLTGPNKLDAPKLDDAQRSIGRMLMASRLDVPARPVQAGSPPVVAGYTFFWTIGAGTFGTVWLARHEPTGKLRAVKVGPLTDPARFRQEVDIARRLNSPHLVQYFESGEVGPTFWIAMEYLGDTTLAGLMARTDFRDRPFLLTQIGEQILAGLADLHAAGMIHRDLKPANVMVDDEFRLKLIDFGLAKPVDKADGYAGTKTGTLIGTPPYMSPEQLEETKDLTPASDVYAAGAVIYEVFTGHPPHQADAFAKLILKVFKESIPFDRPELPADLRPFLERCLRREANARYADGRAALADFRIAASRATRQLRHAHYRQAWGVVIQGGQLEAFAAEHLGILPDDAVDQFQERLRKDGRAECDRERLGEILPPVFAAQHHVQTADETLATAKLRLAADATRLSAEQMRQRVEEIHRLEESVSTARTKVTAEVRRLLAVEVAAWEELVAAERKAAAVAEAKRQEELRRAAEVEQRRRDEEERARRARQAELRRQEAEEREYREREARAEALRNKLVGDMRNKSLRAQYLRERTPRLEKRDASIAGAAWTFASVVCLMIALFGCFFVAVGCYSPSVPTDGSAAPVGLGLLFAVVGALGAVLVISRWRKLRRQFGPLPFGWDKDNEEETRAEFL